MKSEEELQKIIDYIHEQKNRPGNLLNQGKIELVFIDEEEKHEK